MCLYRLLNLQVSLLNYTQNACSWFGAVWLKWATNTHESWWAEQDYSFPAASLPDICFSPPQLHTGFSGTTCQSEGFLLASKGDGRQQTHLPDTKKSLQKCHVHFVCTAAISHRFHYSRIWRLFSWLIDTFLCSIRICHSRSERLKLSLVVASTLQNKTFPVTEGRKPAILSD